MSIPISDLKGMTSDIEQHLREKGIRDSDALLEATKTPAQRRAIAQGAGVADRVILELANRADLSRIKGVAGVYSDLLEQTGVDTCKELAMRRPDNLHAKIREINGEKKLAARIPTLEEVEDWISQAKTLPKILTY